MIIIFYVAATAYFMMAIISSLQRSAFPKGSSFETSNFEANISACYLLCAF